MDATLFWDNTALPTPTLTLPDTSISTFGLFPSFLLKINAFLVWFEKGEKKKFTKRRIRTRVDRIKMSKTHIPFRRELYTASSFEDRKEDFPSRSA